MALDEDRQAPLWKGPALHSSERRVAQRRLIRARPDAGACRVHARDAQVVIDVVFEWRPLAQLHDLLVSWTGSRLAVPAVRTDHTITLTANRMGR